MEDMEDMEDMEVLLVIVQRLDSWVFYHEGHGEHGVFLVIVQRFDRWIFYHGGHGEHGGSSNGFFYHGEMESTETRPTGFSTMKNGSS